MGNKHSAILGVEDIPVWPGDVSCEYRRGVMVDAFSTAPDGLPDKSLRPGTTPNSCSMICLPSGFKNVGQRHGIKYGGDCFGDSDDIDDHTYADGTKIHSGTPVCPGYTYEHSGKVAGVEFFQYRCNGGDVINYGAPYK
jgi:hypothetical protein